MEYLKLIYDPKLYKEWLDGSLKKEWVKSYPDLFDEDDFRITIDQKGFHFGEWFVAIHYHKQGYKVLVEKFIYKNHPKKLKIVNKILGKDNVEYLRSLKNQPPDLFIYKGKNFFFSEVKKDTDKLSKSQEECFNEIAKKLKTRVVIAELKKRVPVSSKT